MKLFIEIGKREYEVLKIVFHEFQFITIYCDVDGIELKRKYSGTDIEQAIRSLQYDIIKYLKQRKERETALEMKAQ